MNGIIRTPEMSDIDRLSNRIASLEIVLHELLLALFDDGTIDEEELDELQQRLG